MTNDKLNCTEKVEVPANDIASCVHLIQHIYSYSFFKCVNLL